MKRNHKMNLLLIIYIIAGFVFSNICFNSNAFSQPGWNIYYLNNKECAGINFPCTDTGYIFQIHGDLYKTINKGNNWNIVNTEILYMGNGKFTTSTLGIVVGLPCKLTTTGGTSWTEVSNYFPGIGDVNIQDQVFINSISGYCAGIDFYPLPMPCCYDGVIYKTSNSGTNWQLIYRHGGDQLQEIKFKDENNIKALDKRAFITTTNGGNNWTYFSEMLGDFRFFSAISMTDPFSDIIYLAGFISGDTAAVLKTTNRGNTWFKSMQLPYHSRLRKIFFLNYNTGYAVGDTGLIVRTTNGGEDWSVQNSGTRKKLNGVWFLNKDTGFVVGDSGIVLKTFTGGVMTSINSTTNEIPGNYFLSQNYPNPFNPLTQIKYDLPNYNFVTIKIYDVLGKELLSLVNEFKQAGSYSVTFDATNYTSGVYYYKIKTVSFVQVKKMVLIR